MIYLRPNHIVRGSRSSAGEETEKGLALYEERQVETPYTSCEDYNNLILIPDGNAGRFYKYPFRKAQGNGKDKEDSDVRAKHDQ